MGPTILVGFYAQHFLVNFILSQRLHFCMFNFCTSNLQVLLTPSFLGFKILIRNNYWNLDVIFSPITYNIYRCPLFNIVLKVHPMGCVDSFTHLLTSLAFPMFDSKWLFLAGQTTVILPIGNSLSMTFGSPHYGGFLIDSHIFILKVLIKCSFKGFPIILWKFLLELVIMLRLYFGTYILSFFSLCNHGILTYSFTTCYIFVVVFW